MDAAVARSDLRALSIRPSWVQWEGNYSRNLAPALRDPEGSPSASLWAYIDAYDLADAIRLAAEGSTPGHEVMYVAAPDNATGRPLRELISHHFGAEVSVGELTREDAGGISSAKAARLIGYRPTRSWRDSLSADGVLLDEARERLARGQTGVQLGRAALS